MPRKRILLVEDDDTIRVALEKFLRREFDVGVSVTVSGALIELQNKTYDLGLIDLKLPDGNGLDLMTQAQKIIPNWVTIVMTGNGDSESAIQAIQKGAFHYLSKPFSLEELRHLIDKALKHCSLEKENHWFQRELKHKYQFDHIMGSSLAMMNVFKMIEKVSQTDTTVLIQGESGTGKELIAKAIHYNSDRAHKPLVTVNCGALPEELLESELFGHVKGAFTGAHYSRQGRFEIADQGTIFLDEVGDMSSRLQVKLLRVLQEQKFEPVGSSQSIDVSVRVISATHQDLEQAVQEKKFREDLYYRLNVIPILIPPLRLRTGDVSILLNYFLKKFNDEKNKSVREFSKEAFDILCAYRWPGNVRELENLIERLVILKGEGIIEPRDLPHKFFASSPLAFSTNLPIEGVDLNDLIERFEDNLIVQAMRRTSGNRNRAAGLLGLKRTTLVEKLKRKKNLEI